MTDHDVFGRRLRDGGATVPVHWRLEVANALLQGVRRGKVDLSDVTSFLSALQALPIMIDELSGVQAWGESLVLARNYGLSVYDSAYLEVAVRRSLPLATLDKALARAARAEDVEVIGG